MGRMVPELKSGIASLTGWRPGDAGLLHRVLNLRGVMADQKRTEPISLEECVERVSAYDAAWANDRIGRWAVRTSDTDTLVGYAGFTPAVLVNRPNDFEIGARFDPAFQRCGLARQLQSLCQRFVFDVRGQDRILTFHAIGLYGTNEDGTSKIPHLLSQYEYHGRLVTVTGEEVELYELSRQRYLELNGSAELGRGQ